jgi:hypothetical protein
LTVTRFDPLLQTVLPGQGSNGWATLFGSLSSGGQLTVFSFLANVMSILVQFSGPTIFLGGLLSFREHIRSGKELVSLGTTVGFADLLLLLPALASNQFGPPLWIAWCGLLFSVFASRHIKGPQSSYAGEVRKLLINLRIRLNSKDNKRRLARRRSRRARVRKEAQST